MAQKGTLNFSPQENKAVVQETWKHLSHWEYLYLYKRREREEKKRGEEQKRRRIREWRDEREEV